ncbi:MAG: hypothetical protein BWY75_01889 [bacterium ADurb.Bin425]|nr:MAG: hypothetical protein BWY75_01889 [bacterium ADurb.Bin425]
MVCRHFAVGFVLLDLIGIFAFFAAFDSLVKVALSQSTSFAENEAVILQSRITLRDIVKEGCFKRILGLIYRDFAPAQTTISLQAIKPVEILLGPDFGKVLQLLLVHTFDHLTGVLLKVFGVFTVFALGPGELSHESIIALLTASAGALQSGIDTFLHFIVFRAWFIVSHFSSNSLIMLKNLGVLLAICPGRFHFIPVK